LARSSIIFAPSHLAPVTYSILSFTIDVTNVFAYSVARVAQSEPNAEHHYGHSRFETPGTIGITIVSFTIPQKQAEIEKITLHSEGIIVIRQTLVDTP
jgi:hypothetical protein